MSQQQETINIKEELNKFKSEIINSDNVNIFEELVCKTNKLKLIYQMTRDGRNRESIQNKINNHSNLITIVKTDEGKIFGGYISCKLEYPSSSYKKDNKSFLFSIDLNMKFNIKNGYYAIRDSNDCGIYFLNDELVLFGWSNNSECYSRFGWSNCHFNNKGITRKGYCGGTKRSYDSNNFTPIEIEIYEIIN